MPPRLQLRCASDEDDDQQFWCGAGPRPPAPAPADPRRLSLGLRSLAPGTPRPNAPSRRPGGGLRRSLSARAAGPSPPRGPALDGRSAFAAALPEDRPMERGNSAGWAEADVLDRLTQQNDHEKDNDRASPAYVKRLAQQADALVERGQYGAALPLLDRILRSRPGDDAVVGALFARAHVLVALGRLPEAVTGCRAVLRRRAGHWRAQALCGDAHAQLGQHQQAVRCFRRALQLAPGEQLVRVRLRRAQLRAYAAIAAELRASERAYVAQLRFLVNEVMLPVRAQQLLSPADVTAVFANADMLFRLNETLLASLEQEGEPLDAVLQAFAGLIPYFRMYARFCGNYEAALAALDDCRRRSDAFDEFVAAQAARGGRTCQLRDLLVRPVQRLAHYREAFERLMQCATPADPEHAELQRVAREVRRVDEEVGRRIADMAAGERLLQLAGSVSGLGGAALVTPFRRLLDEFSVEVAEGGGPRRPARQLLLFNDLVLIGKRDDGEPHRVAMRQAVPLAECVADDRTGEPESVFLFHGRTRYTVWACEEQYHRDADAVEPACAAAVAARLYDALEAARCPESSLPGSGEHSEDEDEDGEGGEGGEGAEAADCNDVFAFVSPRMRHALALALSTAASGLELLFVAHEYLPQLRRLRLPPPRPVDPAQVRKDLRREVVLLNGERFVGATMLDELAAAVDAAAEQAGAAVRVFAAMSRTVSGGDAFELVHGLLGASEHFRLTCPQMSGGASRSAPIEADVDARRASVRSADVFEVHEVEGGEHVVLAVEVLQVVPLPGGPRG